MNAGIQTTCTETFGEWLLYYTENFRKTGVTVDSYTRFLQYADNIPRDIANTMLDKVTSEQL